MGRQCGIHLDELRKNCWKPQTRYLVIPLIVYHNLLPPEHTSTAILQINLTDIVSSFAFLLMHGFNTSTVTLQINFKKSRLSFVCLLGHVFNDGIYINTVHTTGR